MRRWAERGFSMSVLAVRQSREGSGAVCEAAPLDRYDLLLSGRLVRTIVGRAILVAVAVQMRWPNVAIAPREWRGAFFDAAPPAEALPNT